MKKVSFFLSALALVAFAACNNTAEEAVVGDAVDTPATDVVEVKDSTADAPEGETTPEGGEAAPAQVE